MDPRVLLDTSTPFDERKVKLLDTVANAMYSSLDTQSREVAHKVLSELQNQPQAWTYVAIILNHSTDANTKFFALRILENCIQTRWQILPEQEKAGIKQYVSELALQVADNEMMCQTEKHFVNKVNESLIQIVKHEWPDKWPTFITELCKSSRAKQSICENNMRLLVLLSEEVFDFGNEQLASKKLHRLKMEFTSQFQEVFDLCKFIIESYLANAQAVRPSLITQTLQCLTHFLKWIPLPFIFENQLLDYLVEYFWDVNTFRIDCVRCLTEICSLQLDDYEERYKHKLCILWRSLCGKLLALPPESTCYDDVAKVPRPMRHFWEAFYVQLALCLTAFLRNHREKIAEAQDPEALRHIMGLLVRLTEIQHDETFKICLDFWNHLVEVLLIEVWRNYRVANGQAVGPNTSPLPSPNDPVTVLPNPAMYSERLQYYHATLHEVRRVMIERMAKPQEVYIQYDEETGEVTKEYQTDTDEVALYNTMRDTQVLLTNLSQTDTKDIMLTTLSSEEMKRRDDPWNPTALNRLCWSIGSISGAMDETHERDFLVHVIRNLLTLCEMKKGKSNKAVVASNIMYICGQYPRFLRQHIKFLKTVVLKLFEFMTEDFPGIQKMACEAFLKVSQKCSKAMAIKQGDEQPFLHEILLQVDTQISRLEDKHKLYFYQAVGHIISSTEPDAQPRYIQELTREPNNRWEKLLASGASTPNVLCEMKVAKEIIKVLVTNQAIARSTGIAFSQQLINIYPQLLALYGLYSKKLVEEYMNSNQRINHTDCKLLHLAKKETLQLVDTFITSSIPSKNDTESTINVVNGNGTISSLDEKKSNIMEHFVCPLLPSILESYNGSPPAIREHEVLALLSTVLECLGNLASPCLPKIFDCVFDCTLDMIKGDFHSFPDHRGAFYHLLMMCNRNCFHALFELPQDKLRSYVESLVWAFKHEHPSVAEQGLQITYEFVKNLVESKPQVLLDFCRTFYLSILHEILNVLTDTLHRSGFKYQTLILMVLIDMLESKLVHDENAGLTKNVVLKNLVELLVNSFPTINRTQAEAFAIDLFTFSCFKDEPQRFQTHIRDFLIQMKEFAGDNEELFESDRQEALHRAQQLEYAKRTQVPGLTQA